MKIALVGNKTEGKAFVAWYLETKYGFKRMKMQYGVSRTVQVFYGIKVSDRPNYIQRLAMYDALYKIDSTIHINYLLRRLQTVEAEKIVVEDARYVNEVDALSKTGFTIVRVTTSGNPKTVHIGSGISTADIGTVKLAEYFSPDISMQYRVDYNIVFDSRDSTRTSVDNLISIKS